MPSPERSPKPLWRNISFTLMWTSTAASGFGDRMIMLAALALLGGLAAGVDSTATLASTQFWFFLPYLIVSIIGGWLADHLPRKWLLLGCDEARALILFASFFLLAQATGPADIPESHRWKVYLALCAVGAFASIFNPTRNAIIPQIIPRPQLQAGNAIILVINVVASMIGMLVGGEIISPDAASSVRTGLLTGALFYLVSGSFFAFLKPIGPVRGDRATERRSFVQALAYATRHRRVLILIGLNVMVWASAAVVSSGVTGVVKVHYGLDGDALMKSFTQISAVLGAGMLVGAAVVVAMRTRRESMIVTMVAIIFAGLCVIVLAVAPWMPATYIAAFGIGVSGNVAIITILTMLQTITPNFMRGRVMGLAAMINTIFSVTTYFSIWRLPDADRNILYVMLVLGTALMVVGGVGLFRQMTRGSMPNSTANFFWHLSRLVMLVWHRLRWVGRHHIPHEGPVVLASNHTTGIDPMLIQAANPRMIRWLMLTSYRLKVTEPLWRAIEPVTLDRDGKDLAKVRAIIAVLRDDQIVGMFPEGGLQRERRELRPFEPGVAMVAKRTGAAIVPVWVSGTPQRRRMIWHFLQPSHSVVTFGEPYTVDKSQDNDEIMADLRDRMIALSHTVEPRSAEEPEGMTKSE